MSRDAVSSLVAVSSFNPISQRVTGLARACSAAFLALAPDQTYHFDRFDKFLVGTRIDDNTARTAAIHNEKKIMQAKGTGDWVRKCCSRFLVKGCTNSREGGRATRRS